MWNKKKFGHRGSGRRIADAHNHVLIATVRANSSQHYYCVISFVLSFVRSHQSLCVRLLLSPGWSCVLDGEAEEWREEWCRPLRRQLRRRRELELRRLRC